MTPKEFIIWLQGFAKSCSEYNITPKQWDDIRDKLKEVDLKDENVKFSRYSLDSPYINNENTNTTN